MKTINIYFVDGSEAHFARVWDVRLKSNDTNYSAASVIYANSLEFGRGWLTELCRYILENPHSVKEVTFG